MTCEMGLGSFGTGAGQCLGLTRLFEPREGKEEEYVELLERLLEDRGRVDGARVE